MTSVTSLSASSTAPSGTDSTNHSSLSHPFHFSILSPFHITPGLLWVSYQFSSFQVPLLPITTLLLSISMSHITFQHNFRWFSTASWIRPDSFTGIWGLSGPLSFQVNGVTFIIQIALNFLPPSMPLLLLCWLQLQDEDEEERLLFPLNLSVLFTFFLLINKNYSELKNDRVSGTSFKKTSFTCLPWTCQPKTIFLFSLFSKFFCGLYVLLT